MTNQETLRVLDPTFVPAVVSPGMADRPRDLNGKTVGLLANHKLNAEELLEAIHEVLTDSFTLAPAHRVNKGNASRPADPDLLDEIAAAVDVVITANGD